MKRLIYLLVIFIIVLPGCNTVKKNTSSHTEQSTSKDNSEKKEQSKTTTVITEKVDTTVHTNKDSLSGSLIVPEISNNNCPDTNTYRQNLQSNGLDLTLTGKNIYSPYGKKTGTLLSAQVKKNADSLHVLVDKKTVINNNRSATTKNDITKETNIKDKQSSKTSHRSSVVMWIVIGVFLLLLIIVIVLILYSKFKKSIPIPIP